MPAIWVGKIISKTREIIIKLQNLSYVEHHGPHLDEVDLRALKSPIYQSTKEDTKLKTKHKMIQLTEFGIQSLEEIGVFVDKRGYKRDCPLDFTTSGKKIDSNVEHQVQELSGCLDSLIGKYYSPPEEISNRAIKRARHDFENYKLKIKIGYQPGGNIIDIRPTKFIFRFWVFWGGGVKISNFCFHNFFFLARRILRSEAQASQARGSTRLVAPGSTEPGSMS